MRRTSKPAQTAQGHALARISPETRQDPLKAIEDQWSTSTLEIQQRLHEAVERDDHHAAHKWSIAGRTATELTLTLKGRPTQITANLHAHRHELGDVMDKLAVAARVVDVHRRKGYLEPKGASARPQVDARAIEDAIIDVLPTTG